MDGTLYKTGQTYPPTSIYNDTMHIDVGQYHNDSTFYIYRGYVSFDTSAIRDYAVLTEATLKLKTYGDFTPVEFYMQVMGGTQPIYGSNLETSDWDCGTVQVANWFSTLYPGDNIYVNITVPIEQINKLGRTQFELKSNREGIQPCGPDKAEYVMFYSGEFSGSEPRLEITWLPNNFRHVNQHWYYLNSTGRDKLAVVLFGGWAYVPYEVVVASLFTQDATVKKKN
ncbi:MAG: hypothetical protein ACUVT5_02075 [Candidatus Bathyarchaeales archaeon]